MSDQVVIELTEVSVYQTNNSLVLHDVNLRVEKGQFNYLIGKTGSGKSSLLKTIYGELPVLKGTGEVAGYSLNHLNRKDIPYLRRKIGIVFQDFNLLSDRNVLENLLFVLTATGWKDKKKKEKRAKEVLEMVGLGTKDYKMPHELSGGEQQRVVIARALLNNPELILADEPTGNLDPEVSDEIMLLLKKINEAGNAVLMATHDYRIINKFPAGIIKCENGKVTPQEYVA